MPSAATLPGENILADGNATIVFDSIVAPQVMPAWFDSEFWYSDQRLRVGEGGRGGVAYVDTPAGECVLRHYRRGGAMAALLGDRYLWRGRDRTRGFAEFRLLRELHALGLPVPRAVAARCQRVGRYYTADLMTLCIAQAQTIAQHVANDTFDDDLAQRVGALVACFHRRGVFHADLNAHNVLMNPTGLYLIDFDRGAMRTPAHGWQQANLARLHRSLLKLGAARAGGDAFERGVWAVLSDAYERGMTA